MSRLNFALSIGLLAVVLAPYWWEDFPDRLRDKCRCRIWGLGVQSIPLQLYLRRIPNSHAVKH